MNNLWWCGRSDKCVCAHLCRPRSSSLLRICGHWSRENKRVIKTVMTFLSSLWNFFFNFVWSLWWKVIFLLRRMKRTKWKCKTGKRNRSWIVLSMSFFYTARKRKTQNYRGGCYYDVAEYCHSFCLFISAPFIFVLYRPYSVGRNWLQGLVEHHFKRLHLLCDVVFHPHALLTNVFSQLQLAAKI